MSKLSNIDSDSEKPSFLISVRFLSAILGFFGYCIQYSYKIDMSVAIICMVNYTALQAQQAASGVITINSMLANYTNDSESMNFTSNSKCLKLSQHSTFDGEYVWDKKIQGYILSSFFYGYIATELASGYLSLKFGGKNVYFVAMLIGAVTTIVTPFCARWHYIAVIVCRLVTGLSQGAIWPSLYSFWEIIFLSERSRLVGLAVAGAQIGNVITLPLGGYFCVHGGWPILFYLLGGVGVGYSIIWILLTSNRPADHRFASEKEKKYVSEQTKEIVKAFQEGESNAPWKALLTSKACIAVYIGHTCVNMGTYLFVTNIPTYMKEVLQFDIKSNGLLSAIPYLSCWISVILSSIIADKLFENKILSKNIIRIIFNLLGFLIPLGAIIGLGFATCASPYVGVALLTVALAFTGCCFGAGFIVSFGDIAGPYAGLFFGVSNTFASVPGIVAPYMVSALTTHQKQEEWRTVFLITAAIYLVGIAALVFIGNTNLQPWAMSKESAKRNELQNSNNNVQNGVQLKELKHIIKA